mgnify:CR=1 FL=1
MVVEDCRGRYEDEQREVAGMWAQFADKDAEYLKVKEESDKAREERD